MFARLTLRATALLLCATVSPSFAAGPSESPGAVRYALEPAASDAKMTPRILRDDATVKIALVSIAAGATMPEHATPVPVTVQTLSGSGSMTVSGEAHRLAAGSIYYMDADAPHALAADGDGPLVVLVHYLRAGAGKEESEHEHEHGNR